MLYNSYFVKGLQALKKVDIGPVFNHSKAATFMEVYISKATGETSEDTKQAAKEPPPPLKKHLEITFQVLNQ